jgi:hypothetical protein
MAWRLAGSLDVLRAEVGIRHPGTTVWTIADEAHGTNTDHFPNAAGVVCASDTLADAGLDLAWYAARVVASGHPALKYVIYNRRIWSTARAAEGWRPYSGDNPHTSHVHVSVGTGPDGSSTGPYDDRSPWGLLAEEDDMDARDVWLERLAPDATVLRAYPGIRKDGYLAQTWLQYTYRWARRAADRAAELAAGQAAILAAVAGTDVLAAVRAELDRHRAQLLAELGDGLADQLAERLAEVVPAEQVRTAVAEVLAARDRRAAGDGTR